MASATEPLRRDMECLDGTQAASSHDTNTAFSFTIANADEKGLRRYDALCAKATSSPSQHPLWIRSWISAAKPDCLLAFIERQRKPVFGFCLAIVREGPFRIARVMAGSHANGNYFPASDEFLATASPELFASFFAAIHRARPEIDMLAFERQSEAIGPHPNPLLCLPHRESQNIALAVDLDGGFDAVLARTSGKRKCKKHRSQIRKFDAAGGYRYFRGGNESEIDRLLSAYFEMKARRFAVIGVRDVFASAEIRTFFRILFKAALAEEKPPFFLQGLEIGGKPRAVTGMSAAQDRLICEFGGISEDELTGASPGDFLFFENIKQACEEGFPFFDFSVGDEPYKRLWCNVEVRQFDVLVPLTLKGRAALAAWTAIGHAKRLIKNNPLAWQWARRLRSVIVTKSRR